MTEPIDEGSFLLINKPLKWTSFDAVNKLRHLLKTKKIGHAGTLDPLATGLLIVCVGKMTKRIDELTGLDKEYTGKFVLGQTTPSFDMETAPSAAVDISHLIDDAIRTAAKTFIGKINQIPPIHSSIWVNGRRSYDLAREGKEVKHFPREVEIKEFEITSIEKPFIGFRVVCSKGTYIRSLANDLGAALGVGGYLAELCRTRIGIYLLKDAEPFEAIRDRLRPVKPKQDAAVGD